MERGASGSGALLRDWGRQTGCQRRHLGRNIDVTGCTLLFLPAYHHGRQAAWPRACAPRLSDPSLGHAANPPRSLGTPTASSFRCPIPLARPENTTLPARVLIQFPRVPNDPRRGERPALRGSVQRRFISHRCVTRDKALLVMDLNRVARDGYSWRNH